jgi:hypothetical protein
MACFSRGKCWINRYAVIQCNVPQSPRDAHRYSSLVNERIGDLALVEPLQGCAAASIASKMSRDRRCP